MGIMLGEGLMNFRKAYIFVMFLFFSLYIIGQDNNVAEKPEKIGDAKQQQKINYPNKKFFLHLEKIWKAGKFAEFQSILAKERVSLRLGNYRKDYYTRDQVVGILKSYFAKNIVLDFKYEVKKMKKNRGVATYKFRERKTGKIYEKKIYFYLRETKTKKNKTIWVITEISEAGHRY